MQKFLDSISSKKKLNFVNNSVSFGVIFVSHAFSLNFSAIFGAKQGSNKIKSMQQFSETMAFKFGKITPLRVLLQPHICSITFY